MVTTSARATAGQGEFIGVQNAVWIFMYASNPYQAARAINDAQTKTAKATTPSKARVA